MLPNATFLLITSIFNASKGFRSSSPVTIGVDLLNGDSCPAVIELIAKNERKVMSIDSVYYIPSSKT